MLFVTIGCLGASVQFRPTVTYAYLEVFDNNTNKNQNQKKNTRTNWYESNWTEF